MIRLERNYRSTPHILAAASGLIAHNEGRLGKTLWTDVNEGERVRIQGVWDGEQEARVVGSEIEARHSKGDALNDMAVLVRAGFQTREFEERLITLGIPYRVIGGARFYERHEIRDAIAYLRTVQQADDDLAFERIINVPKRGIGQAAMQTLHVYARAEGLPLYRAVLQLIETDELRPQVRKSLADLMADFERWRSLVHVMRHSELAGMVLDESGYTAMWKESRAPEAPGRLDNLKEMVAAMEEFDNLIGFLEHVSLVMENEESTSDDKMTLMTLHGAKGLEFDTVFLPGWEEGLFPHQRALDEGGTGGLEEERRLAYVGLTRARKRAMVLYAANRRIYGQWQSSYPSRFIDEIPPEHVHHETETGFAQTRGFGSDLDDTGDAPGLSDSWRRNRARGRALTGDSGAWRVAERQASGGTFEIAERIFHQKFGYGRITAIDGDKLEIDFEKAGHKRVMASFVEKT